VSYAIDRAIEAGYDAACRNRKDADNPYNVRHPMWRWCWEAQVIKSDIPDYGLERVRREVLARVRLK
jgi:hypothetical protein